jgi:hypothetical protein
MAVPARWIRIETGPGFARACEGFAHAQSVRSAPAVLWARAEREIALAVVAPLKFAPGIAKRWRAWGLSPLIAAFRQAGLRAYLEEDGIWFGGRRVASGEARAAGGCVVVRAAFSPPGARFLDTVRERIESQLGWQFDHGWPSSAEREAMLEHANAH